MGKDLVEAAARAAQYNESERMHLEDDLSLLAANCLNPDLDEPSVDFPPVSQPDNDSPNVEQDEDDDDNDDDDDDVNEVVYVRTTPAIDDAVVYLKTTPAAEVQYIKTVKPRRVLQQRDSIILRSHTRLRRSSRLSHHE